MGKLNKFKNTKSVSKLMILTIIGAILITGCGKSEDKEYEDMSKDELITEIYDLESRNSKLFTENANYKKLISSIDSSGSTLPAISTMNDGSGNLTFNTYDSKMIFPSTWQYPGSKEISANTRIVLAEHFSVAPSNGWITKLSGASLELEHTNGVSGLIKVGQIEDMYDTKLMKDEVVAPWFSSFSKETVIYTDIFVDNRMRGVQAKTPIYIDGEEAYLKAGIFGLGEYSVQYVFVYRGINDASKDEVIDAILNSMTLLNLDVSIS